jgi:hypothetical protein
VGQREVADFKADLRRRGRAVRTINRYANSVSLFYRWLAQNGYITESTVTVGQSEPPPFAVRDTLSLPELRRLCAAASTPRERVIAYLLGLNSLGVQELSMADVSDLSVQDGFGLLRLEKRRNSHSYPMTVLDPAVLDALMEYIGDRRSGPLVLSTQNERIDRRSVARVVARLGRHAGVPFVVTPITLTFTMRALAIQHGFSYVSVVRAAGEFEARALRRWIVGTPHLNQHHAAVRLSRLVLGTGSEHGDSLASGDVLLSESDVHPAVAVMLAGATLERHLRRMAIAAGIPVEGDSRRGSITSYAARLKSEKALDAADVQHLAHLANRRDDAAHGWFDRVSAADAQWVLREVWAFCDRHPVAEQTS